MRPPRVHPLVAATALLLVGAVVWDAARSAQRTPAAASAVRTASAGSERAAAPPLPAPDEGRALARAETRRRIRESAGFTYLNEIVAASRDSMLHRWVRGADDPVRVWFAPPGAAGANPGFDDAVRDAFARWTLSGVPVRFAFVDDSARADVLVRWRAQFDTDRTGQTDLAWDGDGRLVSAVVTIATHDPRGRPLGAEDVRAVALHEVGHVLGLDHSPDSADVMFPTTIAHDLSARDVATAILLYDLAPGSLR